MSIADEDEIAAFEAREQAGMEADELRAELAEAVRLLRSVGLDDRGSCNECGAERVGDAAGYPGDERLEMHAETCPLRVFLAKHPETPGPVREAGR